MNGARDYAARLFDGASETRKRNELGCMLYG